MAQTLKEVLAKGAKASAAITVQPDFTGHALCDPDPFVQGLSDPAPFHPTAAGELAIAMADQAALRRHAAAPSPSPGTSSLP